MEKTDLNPSDQPRYNWSDIGTGCLAGVAVGALSGYGIYRLFKALKKWHPSKIKAEPHADVVMGGIFGPLLGMGAFFMAMDVSATRRERERWMSI